MPRNLADVLYELRQGAFRWDLVAQEEAAAAAGGPWEQGRDFEGLLKDLLAGVTPALAAQRQALWNQHLCFTGAANNPPDAMFRGGDEGDAFEFKKHRVVGSIQLNSSPPYCSLRLDMPQVAPGALFCGEEWNERDLFYVVGNIEWGRALGNEAWIVAGETIARNYDHYVTIKNNVSNTLQGVLPGLGYQMGQTQEIAQLVNTDARNTNLRVRSMWVMQDPRVTFGGRPGLQRVNPAEHCRINAVLTRAKWDSLVERSDRAEVQLYWTQHPADGQWHDQAPDGVGVQELVAFSIVIP